MKKITKILIIFICFLSLTTISIVKEENNSKILLKEKTNFKEENTNNYDSNSLIMVEIICGIIGVIMLYIAAKTNEN